MDLPSAYGWHHYCLTYDGSDYALYVDGSVVSSEAKTLNTGTEFGFQIGNWNEDHYFQDQVPS